MSLLSIAIPTYNRPDSVARRLREIAEYPEISQVVICDNSPQPSLPAGAEAADPKIRYHRNRANIGGGANFLRTIEHAETPYVWWRGDDDPISAAQVAAVSGALEEEPCLILLNPRATQPFTGRGVGDFCRHFDLVQPMGWLSMIVLPAPLAQRSLRWGYWGIGTGWANVCLVLGLFKEAPDLRFKVVPFTMQEGDFRETGREAGLPWAFFTTCIQQFPRTAELIADETNRVEYLAGWRGTQSFKLCLTMVRLKLGLMKAERISWQTLRPLVTWRNPRTTLLAVVLRLIAALPSSLWRALVAWWAGHATLAKLEQLGLGDLVAKKYSERYAKLRGLGTKDTAGSFL